MSTKHPSLLSVGAAIMALLGGAAPSGLVAHAAELQLAESQMRRRDDEEDNEELLLAIPPDSAQVVLAGHRSHRSHSSHRSHYSGSSRSHYSGGGGSYVPAPAPVVPPAPKPALVSFVAYPGGRIFVDGKAEGEDVTGQLRLAAGKHTVRVENRFLGSTEVEVELSEGQTGEIRIDW